MKDVDWIDLAQDKEKWEIWRAEKLLASKAELFSKDLVILWFI